MRLQDGQVGMDIRNSNTTTHLKTAGGALINWWRAATLDALIVGVLWLIGLELIRVPFAPFWAILGGVLQIVPTFGGMIGLIGPVLAVAFSGHDEWRLGLVLGLYGLIVILEGLVIGPYVLHRTTRVPWWAAFLGAIVLGIIIPFWGGEENSRPTRRALKQRCGTAATRPCDRPCGGGQACATACRRIGVSASTSGAICAAGVAANETTSPRHGTRMA